MDLYKYLSGVKRGSKNPYEPGMPFFQGRRLRAIGEYPPGTLFVKWEEYLELKKLEKQGKYQTSELDAVAARMIQERKQKEAQQKKKLKPKKRKSCVTEEERKAVKAFTEKKSQEMVETFFTELVTDSFRGSYSQEELQLKKQELSAEITEAINTKFQWALQDAYLKFEEFLNS